MGGKSLAPTAGRTAALTWTVCGLFERSFLTASSAHVKHTLIALGEDGRYKEACISENGINTGYCHKQQKYSLAQPDLWKTP